MPTHAQGEETIRKLRAFEGKTIREAAIAIGRCTVQVSRLCKKHGLKLLVRETDALPRERAESGRLRIRMDAITPELVREWLDYDQETGILTWKKSHLDRVGSAAGAECGLGYLTVGFFGLLIPAHRLAWFHVHGKWPTEFLDHVDGNGRNNVFVNLREATPLQNMHNVLAKGYSVSKYGKFVARLNVNKKRIRLGTFETAEEAHAAYRAAHSRFHGEFSGFNCREGANHA